jgi:murein DD-endopeptidase MepM/ murein hydrolase activator NlpD
MYKILLLSGTVSCLLAGVLFILNLTEINLKVGSGNWQLFPAAFFALLGLVLFYRAVKLRLRTVMDIFNPRLLAGPFLLIFLLAACAETPSSCPRFERIDIAEADNYSRDEDLPFRFPLDDYNLYRRIDSAKFANSGYTSPNVREYHAAEDLHHPSGTPVYAMADGKVRFSGPMDGYGWLIIIDHPQANLYSLYGHLSPSRWRTELGPVEKGELIAYLGDSDENGGSSEHPMRPHLHFGLRAGQRADYPGSGEWRWQAGWIKPCPQDLGWLQPSLIITSQMIPAGGFPEPAARFVAKWGLELLLTGIYLFGGACMLFFAIRRKKPIVLILSGIVLLAVGCIFSSKGIVTSYVLFVMAVLFTAIGIYYFVRRSIKRHHTQS